MISVRAQLIACIKDSKNILKKKIPEEHHEAFLNDPDNIPNATLCEVISKIERIKLTYKERLSPHGWRIVRMVMKEKKIVDFVRMWR